MTTLSRNYPLIKIAVHRFASSNGQVEDQFSNDTIPPEEYMRAAEKLLGDGQARVSISKELSTKDFGSGFGAHVSISLACNQDDDTIEKAAEKAGALAMELLEEHLGEAEELYNVLFPPTS